VLQGLVNEATLPAPVVMFNAGYMNFDWPESDAYWNRWLSGQGRATFTNITSSTLCGLVTGADRHQRVRGAVLYEADGVQQEWSIPIATTLASQQQLLPVTAAILAKHQCLAQLKLKMDLTQVSAMADKDTAW
jgi:hypothetical protein